MANIIIDENSRNVIAGISYVDGKTIVPIYADPVTHRLLVDLPGSSSGTVTSVSVVSANGFAGTVATSTTTPAITLSTTITGLLKGNGTAISAATAGTDYSAGTASLATGILKSTTTTGVLSIATPGTDYIVPYTSQTANTFLAAPNGTAGVPSFRVIVPADIPTLNQNTTGTAAIATDTASKTGTGSIYVTNTSPTITTPTINQINASSNTSIQLNAGTYNNIQTYTPTAGGTATLDLSKGNIHHITMPAGNITIALSNGTVGQCFIIRILQDGTGSRTVTWFTTIKWAGGTAPTLTTTASKADTLGFEITGTNTYDGFIVGQNI